MGNEIHAKLMNCRDTSQKWSQSMHFNRFYVLKAVGPTNVSTNFLKNWNLNYILEYKDDLIMQNLTHYSIKHYHIV